jgi:hypothetical protein
MNSTDGAVKATRGRASGFDQPVAAMQQQGAGSDATRTMLQMSLLFDQLIDVSLMGDSEAGVTGKKRQRRQAGQDVNFLLDALHHYGSE